MKSLLSKPHLLILFVLFLQIASINSAHAVSLADAFGSVVGGSGQITQSSKVQTDAFVGVSFGSATVRMPVRSISIVNVSPPYVQAGCSGVKAGFGGISFVTGDQIEELLRNVAQNAKGYVLQLALAELCPICENLIAKIQEWMNWASGFNANSCAIAKNVVNSVVNGVHDIYAGECAKSEAANGNSQDYGEGDNNCTPDSKQKLADNTTSAQDKQERAGLFNSMWQKFKNSRPPSTGSVTDWLSGSAVNLNPGVLENSDDAEEGSEDAALSVFAAHMSYYLQGNRISALYYGKTSGDILFHELMCGWNVPEAPSAKANPATTPTEILGNVRIEMQETCNAKLRPNNQGEVQVKILNEAAERTVGYFTGHAAWDKNDAFSTGLGFLVLDDLESMYTKASSPSPGNGFIGREVLWLEIAPFPLYRVINIAAVYPQVAEEILSLHSKYLAYLLTGAYIEQYFLNRAHDEIFVRDSNGNDFVNTMPPELKRDMDTSIRNVAKDYKEAKDTFMPAFQRNQVIVEQVRSVERVIVQQIHSSGLSGNAVFANQWR